MAQKVTHIPSLEGQNRTNEILEKIASAAAAQAAGSAAPDFLDRTFEAILDGHSNTTATFYLWLAEARQTEEDDYKLLERWFTILSRKIAGKIYTVQGYAAAAGSDSAMTAEDDLKPLGKAALATDTNDGGADWAEEHPLTWYVRFNGISKEDGTMDVKAIEGDSTFDITGNLAPVYTASMALWRKETRDASYIRKSWTSTRQAGFRPYAGDVAPDGTKRPLTWHSTFAGGWLTGDKLTSGAGHHAANFKSAEAGLTAARKWSQWDALWNDCDSYWLLDMWQLRHQSKENSGTLEGCTGYNLQKQVAKVEESTTRVLLAEAEFANFVVGSAVAVGDYSTANLDRGQTAMRNIVSVANITSIQKVNVEATTYTALNLDVTAPFTTKADARVSTMPWMSGDTEGVPGHRDGCIGALTGGKRPIRVAGIETMNGAYAIGIEPLYTVIAGSDGTHWTYDKVSICRDATKLKSTVTADYTTLTGIRYESMAQSWNYVKEFFQNNEDVLFPESVGGTSSTYYRSAFYGTGSAGVRVPWWFANLGDGGHAGLACEYGNLAPSSSTWNGVPRLSGAGKMRGEWRA